MDVCIRKHHIMQKFRVTAAFLWYGCFTFRLAVHSLLLLFVHCIVVGMTSVAVDSFDDIEQWIEQGNKKRSIAATKMNETSRYHLRCTADSE